MAIIGTVRHSPLMTPGKSIYSPLAVPADNEWVISVSAPRKPADPGSHSWALISATHAGRLSQTATDDMVVVMVVAVILVVVATMVVIRMTGSSDFC